MIALGLAAALIVGFILGTTAACYVIARRFADAFGNDGAGRLFQALADDTPGVRITFPGAPPTTPFEAAVAGVPDAIREALSTVVPVAPSSGTPFAKVVVASDEGGQIVATIDDGLVDPLDSPGAADTVTIPRDVLDWDGLVELFFRFADSELAAAAVFDGSGVRFQIVGKPDEAIPAYNAGPGGTTGPALILPWRPLELDQGAP